VRFGHYDAICLRAQYSTSPHFPPRKVNLKNISKIYYPIKHYQTTQFGHSINLHMLCLTHDNNNSYRFNMVFNQAFLYQRPIHPYPRTIRSWTNYSQVFKMFSAYGHQRRRATNTFLLPSMQIIQGYIGANGYYDDFFTSPEISDILEL